jgi:anti-sigma regulatory factor (Ser/Thr protein kinase)
MEVTDHCRLEVSDASGTGHARRVAADMASRLALDEDDDGRVAIVVTEAATNLVKHAGGGELLLHALRLGDARGIGVLALDRGPGLTDLAAAMRDGYSSAGSPGTGLGAIRRQATVFDLHSSPGEGLALLAEVWTAPPAPADRLVAGGVNVPFPGEPVSGDAWDVANTGPRALVLAVDGLGHGAYAADAAAAAVAVFRANTTAGPADVLARIHQALRATRGAAVAVAEVDRAAGLVRFAGVGNIGGTILAGTAARSLVSHYGTAGHDARRIHEFTYPWPAGAALVLHSDGITSRWTLDRYPGLAARHPALMAGVLYRDFRRGRDDASVVVVRERA